MRSSGTSGGILALFLLAGVVALVLIGELPRLLQKAAEQPVPPAPAAPAAPSVPSSPAPPAPAKAPPSAPDLAARLNAELPALGLPPSARIIDTLADGDRLTLVFDGALRKSLTDISALDAWIEALSQHTARLGYRHLGLRVRIVDDRGASRDVTIDSLVATPPAERPRPEPIDDGVRR